MRVVQNPSSYKPWAMATRVVYMRPIDQICAQSARRATARSLLGTFNPIIQYDTLQLYITIIIIIGEWGRGEEDLYTPWWVGVNDRFILLQDNRARDFFCRQTRMFLALSPRTTCLPARDFDGHCTVTAFVFCPFSGAVACRPDYFAGLLFKRLMGSTVLTSYQTEPAVSPPTTRCF